MQERDFLVSSSGDEVSRAFAHRAKAARNQAGLTQAQLSQRLEAEFGVKLDTSAITRIEAGQREPRLSEALAIAEILHFGFHRLTPLGADLDFHLAGVSRLMDQSREILARLLRSVEPVTEFVNRCPDCLGDRSLADVFQEEFESFRKHVEALPFVREDETLNFALTDGGVDEKLKRELLRVVTENVLITREELHAATEKRLAAKLAAKPRGERLWEQRFNQLLDYVVHNGHAQVPQSYIVDGYRLGRWVDSQRKRHAKGNLAADRALQLQELPGWRWDPVANNPIAKQ
jgi:transcriptional regulator with XRE-family HTH domain